MSIEKLKQHLRPWVKRNSWNIGHDKDESSYHHALKRVFDDLGYCTSQEDFKEAINELTIELHPNMQELNRDKSADDYAFKADVISSYLYSIHNP